MWFLHWNVYKVPSSCSENRIGFFLPNLASNVSSTSVTTSKGRDIVVDSRALLHTTSKSDVTPEEQETIRKSNRTMRFYDCK